MRIGCETNVCGIQEKGNKNVFSGILSILKNPSSRCLSWNAFLISIIIVVFGPSIYYDFVYYDDFTYTVAKTDRGNVWTYTFLSWALTSTDDGLWAPVTKISHRIDTHLFGNKAGGHHTVNVILHIINSLILWRLLCRITGDGLVQFLGVCLFAVHPLRVEPVAWIASRKDLLSSLFLFLMLLKYIDWLKEGRKKDYIISFLLFVFSAMSKPVSVVFPLFLPVIDFMLLKKENLPIKRNLFLYVPFFFISIMLALITIHAEQEAIIPVSLSLEEKLSRIIVATSLYFLLTFFPINLHIPYGIEYYPLSGWTQGVPVYDRIDIVIVSLTVILLSVMVWIFLGKRYKNNFLSLILFVLPLIPVVGFIPFGHHLIADRFTYASHFGLCIFICTLLSGTKGKTYIVLNTFLAVIIVILSVASISFYVPLWERGEKLFRNSLKYEPNNYVALCNLGYSLIRQDRYIESIPHLKKAIEVYPYRAGPYNDLAFVYQSLGRYKESINYYLKSLEISGNDPEIMSNIAVAFFEIGDYESSKKFAENALKVNPGLINAKKILEMMKK